AAYCTPCAIPCSVQIEAWRPSNLKEMGRGRRRPAHRRRRLPARSRPAPSRREGPGADMSGRDAQGLGPLLRVLAKEAHHLRRGIRPLLVGMRCARTPPRPGMAHLVDNPLLHEGATLRV